MLTTPPVIPHLPIPILELICDGLAAEVSRLGRILAALRVQQPLWITPTFEIADYLPVPVITVEHKLFGPGLPLHRKLLHNGFSAVVVCYGDISRTLLIDAAYWVTPIEVLMGVELQKVDEFTFPDGSLKIDKRKMPYPDVEPFMGARAWEEARAFRVACVKSQTLEEYADLPRHRDNEAATLPHLPNYCDGCLRHVTVLHDRTDCAAKKQTAKQDGTKRPIDTTERDCPKTKSVSALARVLENDDLAASVVEKIDARFYRAPFQIVQAYKRSIVEKKMIAEKHDRAPHEMRSVNDILLGSV